jgi:hypothetical protein
MIKILYSITVLATLALNHSAFAVSSHEESFQSPAVSSPLLLSAATSSAFVGPESGYSFIRPSAKGFFVL